jgi:hypothetical protein
MAGLANTFGVLVCSFVPHAENHANQTSGCRAISCKVEDLLRISTLFLPRSGKNTNSRGCNPRINANRPENEIKSFSSGNHKIRNKTLEEPSSFPDFLLS